MWTILKLPTQHSSGDTENKIGNSVDIRTLVPSAAAPNPISGYLNIWNGSIVAYINKLSWRDWGKSQKATKSNEPPDLESNLEQSTELTTTTPNIYILLRSMRY
jgi:hypothetical protein